jgi:glycosyltransferase involved in cell wall biosynthesis
LDDGCYYLAKFKMVHNKKISLCIPCRNEGKHLDEVIGLVPKYVDEILIISNNSTDNTVSVAKKIGGKVKVIEDNRVLNGIGYGFAHISGIKAATGDFIVGADGDATYPLEDISKVVEYLTNNDLDFISCNRYPVKDDTEIPFKLRLGVNLLNWEIRLLYGVKIQDALSGMWVFKKEIRNELKLSMGDWNLSPQIKINAATNPKIAFAEYHISQHLRKGETKQNYFKTGFSHASWIFKNRFNLRNR